MATWKDQRTVFFVCNYYARQMHNSH